MPAISLASEPLPGVHLLWLATPETNERSAARLIVRQALRETLSELVATDNQSLTLISQPGQPIRLAPPWSAIGISVSHEPGRSLVAINPNGPVGVDLMRIASAPTDCHTVSRDYLGPQSAAALARLPAEQRQYAFAQAWTRYEACLKCLTLELGEWTPERAERLQRCTLVNLDVPAGWVAAVAMTSAAVDRGF